MGVRVQVPPSVPNLKPDESQAFLFYKTIHRTLIRKIKMDTRPLNSPLHSQSELYGEGVYPPKLLAKVDAGISGVVRSFLKIQQSKINTNMGIRNPSKKESVSVLIRENPCLKKGRMQYAPYIIGGKFSILSSISNFPKRAIFNRYSLSIRQCYNRVPCFSFINRV